ncbi:protein kinase domain-containing protein [Archangium sp.]|uniref:protein kinase domain-containing protein n=1 Tax=Archangium sp. TaxID=1872627 RepID=UPI0038D39D02
MGKYQLVSKLAQGGMAEVFLAKVAGPRGFEKTLVLKRILPHLAEDSQFVEMFFTEARVAAQLNHPHIVQIFDFGQSEGSYYLAMEFIDGPDLRTLLARATQAGLSLPPAFCAKLVSAACEALAFAHDFVEPDTGRHLELIHRDISPDNLLLSRQGALKVVDFGIAKATNQSHKTKTGLIKGKLAYMPVEQLQGQHVDRRADVYALGVVLYELLTGKYPFEATTDVGIMQAVLFEPRVPAASRRPELPQALSDILDKALAKEREQRYPDCISFQADLERFILSTGQSMGARELAQWVERLCPKTVGPATAGGMEKTYVRKESSPGTDRTYVREESSPGTERTYVREEPEAGVEPTLLSPSKSRALAVPAAKAPGRGKTAHVAETELLSQAPRTRGSLTGLGVAVGALVLLAAGGGVLLFRGGPPTAEPQPVPTSVQATQPLAVQSTDSRQAPPVEEKAPEVARPPPEASPPEATSPEPSAVAPARHPPAQKQKTLLEFRVYPHAIVWLDGAALGQTPLASVEVAPGSHTVRLVNHQLGKEHSQTIKVKAGRTHLFKHTFLAD